MNAAHDPSQHTFHPAPPDACSNLGVHDVPEHSDANFERSDANFEHSDANFERFSPTGRTFAVTAALGTGPGASAFPPPSRQPRDQDKALAPSPGRGLLGTQLAPNQNGRRW